MGGGPLGQPDLQASRPELQSGDRHGGELTIVQTQHIRELGEIDPDHVVTPGIFVDRVLHVPYGDPTGF